VPYGGSTLNCGELSVLELGAAGAAGVVVEVTWTVPVDVWLITMVMAEELLLLEFELGVADTTSALVVLEEMTVVVDIEEDTAAGLEAVVELETELRVIVTVPVCV